MTSLFDDYVSALLNECANISDSLILEKCTHETNIQLSDKADFRFMRCIENPYSSGIKKIYFGDKRQKFDLKKCLRHPRRGSATYENCRMAMRALKRKIRLAKLRNQKRKKK